jgi:pyruvate-formate lyase-activating enzyme
MFSDKTYCTLPWSHIQINTTGNFKVCCFTGDPEKQIGEHGIASDDNGNVMNIMTHSLEEAMNSKIHKQIRLVQSWDKRHGACRMCWDKEDAGVESMRQLQTRKNQDVDGFIHIDEAQSKMSEDGSINNLPVYLDIRFGNLCNAKCIHCEPLYSTLWYEDVEAIWGTNKFRVGPETYEIRKENGVYKADLQKWWESENWLKEYEKIKHRIRELYITGGEPMVVPYHSEFLDRLIADGVAGNIRLGYDTNLLAVNQNIISKFKHFGSTMISVSSDDIEERYEYIRYPSNWEKLQRNLRLMKENNIKIDRISMCAGIYSIYSLLRMVPYYNELGYTHTIRQRILNSPTMFDMKWLPREAKIQAIERYKNSNIGDDNSRMTVGYLQNNLDLPENPEMLSLFVKRMDSFDRVRKLDWKNTFPEVAEMVKRYI